MRDTVLGALIAWLFLVVYEDHKRFAHVDAELSKINTYLVTHFAPEKIFTH